MSDLPDPDSPEASEPDDQEGADSGSTEDESSELFGAYEPDLDDDAVGDDPGAHQPASSELEEAQSGAKRLERLVAEDGRYEMDAWRLVLEGLGEASRERRSQGEDPNVDGGVLCQHVRRIASRRFGYLAALVLKRWGVLRTQDFGEIVWALCDAGLLLRRDTDCKSDFEEVYDFRVAFEGEFLHAG